MRNLKWFPPKSSDENVQMQEAGHLVQTTGNELFVFIELTRLQGLNRINKPNLYISKNLLCYFQESYLDAQAVCQDV